ncbi:uncharacterized protein PRCAT00002656001 [Priceomyces carsonii]|uniref:uncharacterized protein n=1 Tax=Priceomyces carsonii TaxID=28549 RepID=UPI002EDB9808|nr:unnamed protein product [Priceomyces carsonii]
MLLSRTVALSILLELGVYGLVIPSADDVMHTFSLKPAEKSKTLAEKPVKDIWSAASNASPVPLVNSESVRDIIADRYIIVMKDEITSDELKFHQEWVELQHINSLAGLESDNSFFLSTADFKAEGGIVDSFEIDNFMKGYYGYFLEGTIDLIRKNPLVKFVERDSMVYANEFNIQKGAPWGLARVSHRQPLSLNSFNQYLYDTDGGAGVTAYVIDTGINIDHVEFNGRAKWGKTIPTGDTDTDGNGHGTHCAGTIGSDSYGIAKNSNLVAVKVLRSNGSGSMSDVVKGVEYAAKSHQDAVKEGKKGFKGSTANMSLGGGKSPALDLAVNAAVKAGIHFAVAAGNENQDACNTSPAAAENAITVGASTISDARAYFSNYGKCVDIFGPGLNILSTYIGSDSATATLSGTSMASPHIAGLLSYYLSLQPGADSEFYVSTKGVTPAQLKKNLIKFGSDGLLSDIPDDGTPNVLAFNGAGKNLTGFWEGSAKNIESVKPKLENLESLIEELVSKVVESADKPVLKDVKEFVENAYNSLI